MILRSIVVRNFGVLSPGVEIDAFSKTAHVVHGPNESGKSTLFRALQYALYQKTNTTDKDVRAAIVPAGTSVGPEVELTFESGGATWRVHKRWFQSASTTLAREDDGVFKDVAQGVAADERLRQILGSGPGSRGEAAPKTRGLGEILIVDQGRLRVDEKDGFDPLARDRLQAVVRKIASTSETHDLVKRVAKERDRHLTPNGAIKKGSPLEEAKERLDAAKERRAAILARIADAREKERVLVELGEESAEDDAERIAEAEADRKRAEDGRVEAAKLAERLYSARKEAENEAKTADALREAVKREESAAERERAAVGEKEAAETELAEARAKLATAVKSRERVQGDLATLEREREAAAEDAARARDAVALDEATGLLQDLDARVEGAAARDAHVASLAAEEARIARPSAREAAEYRRLARVLETAEAELGRRDIRVAIDPERSLTIETAGGSIVLEPGVARDLRGDDALDFRVEGVARFTVGGGALDRATVAADAKRARAELEAFAERFGGGDAASIEELARERAILETRREQATKERDAFFKDVGDRNALLRRRADIDAKRRAVFERRPEWREAPPDPVEAAAAAVRAENALKTAATRIDAVKEALKAIDATEHLARQEIERATTARSKAEVAAAAAKAIREDAARTMAGSPAEAVERAAAAENRAASFRAEAESIENRVAALGDPEGTLERAEKTLTDVRRAREEATRRRTDAEARLDELRKEGLHARLGAVESEIAAEERVVEERRLTSAAIGRLFETLEAARSAAVSEALKPVADRVARMMRFLYDAPEASPVLSEGLAPLAARVGGVETSVGNLSYGAQDQLAILVRLALGELHAESEGRHAFVLDDPLVHCDKRRRGRLLEIFNRASKRLQIVVFTCHPEHYDGLTGDVLRTNLAEARARAVD